MKILECLKSGRIMGLEYVGEAIDTIIYHGDIFSYKTIVRETDELLMEFESLELKEDDLIEDVLLNLYGVKVKDIDDELEKDLMECNKRQGFTED